MEIPADIEEYPVERAATQYFTGSVPKVKLPLSYQLGLSLVAMAMLLLPGIYLGFMGLTGWGMWWWATHANHWLFPVAHGGGHRIFWVFLVLYITPLFVGGILLLFMFKCLFSKW